MSTILKALKKLEQERASLRPDGPTPVSSLPVETAEGLRGWLAMPWVRGGIVATLIFALGVTALHYYHLARSATPQPAASSGTLFKSLPSVDSEKAGHRSTAVDRTAVASRPVRHIENKPAVKTQRPEAVPARRHMDRKEDLQGDLPTRPLPAMSAVRNNNRPPGQPAPATSAVPAATVPDRRVVQSETARAAVRPEQRQAESAVADPYNDAPALKDDRLKVHAIAWSSKADERMAVVNSRVVYEGDTVDGFTVVAVRPEDVVVREKDGGLWRVVFGRP